MYKPGQIITVNDGTNRWRFRIITKAEFKKIYSEGDPNWHIRNNIPTKKRIPDNCTLKPLRLFMK